MEVLPSQKHQSLRKKSQGKRLLSNSQKRISHLIWLTILSTATTSLTLWTSMHNKQEISSTMLLMLQKSLRRTREVKQIHNKIQKRLLKTPLLSLSLNQSHNLNLSLRHLVPHSHSFSTLRNKYILNPLLTQFQTQHQHQHQHQRLLKNLSRNPRKTKIQTKETLMSRILKKTVMKFLSSFLEDLPIQIRLHSA